MALEKPVLTKRIPTEPWGRHEDRHYVDYNEYVNTGGYQALDKSLQMDRSAVIDEIKAAEIRGRGGAGFPAGMKWSFLPPADGGRRYLAINADESEPATFKDRLLIDYDPHQVVEGIAICMYACQLDTAYFYMRGEYHDQRATLERAFKEAYDNGIFGPNSRLGQINGRNPELFLHRGAGAYVCGEETGLLNSLEGKRGWPRIKPPFPAVAGAFARPTIVNNVETLACVPHVMENGPEWFKSLGKGRPEGTPPHVPASFGTKLIGVSGPVVRPDVYEEHLGVKMSYAIETLAGGMLPGMEFKAAIPGGISMGVLTKDEYDAPLDFDIGKKYGILGLGTACITVIPEGYSMISCARNLARFYARESCGQCTPCREGTEWLYKLLTRIEAGEGTTKDLDLLLEVASSMGIMPGTTICGLSDGANWAVRTIVNKFFDEFDAAVSKNRLVSLSVANN
ncbi:NADH-quinone oxidoreductase chain 1 [Poriferisphaera corsica]|uniref:NADH-quinone oxidoreductase chain 1 n=1 Tax=Poriferisphaera corsica TaxID=2528020 RepID=A0A517YVV2_9BACT|nr:NADH-quinone oxidoreductase subunit NuoF [Poriferisphaera corsica]QDU34355.1 NADH-quinone oxidoreductase chain 1 [Poriferisphaera corsica]